MSTLNAAALGVLARQLGLITSDQLRSAGVGRAARQALIKARVLGRPYKSVYSVGTGELTFEQRLVALTLAHRGSFITGATAGGYLKVRRMPTASEIQLCVPHGRRLDAIQGVRFRQSTAITSLDHRTLANGMEIATWPRLFFDLAAELSAKDLMSAIDQGLNDGRCTVEELGAIARRLCHPHRRGSERFAAVLLARGGRRPVDSHPELEVLEGLLARGVPVEPQHSELILPDETTVRIDLAVPAVRWAVEIDVHPSHLGLEGATRDRRRDRQLHLIGWQVERVTAVDLLDPVGLLDELVALYQRRVVSLAAA